MRKVEQSVFLTPTFLIDGETYQNAAYVVAIEATDSRMIRGKDLQRHMNINIRGGRMTIQKIPMVRGDTSTPQSVQDSQEKGFANERYNDDSGRLFTNEFTTINYIEAGEIDVKKPYEEKIRKLIEEHKPNTQVQPMSKRESC